MGKAGSEMALPFYAYLLSVIVSSGNGIILTLCTLRNLVMKATLCQKPIFPCRSPVFKISFRDATFQIVIDNVRLTSEALAKVTYSVIRANPGSGPGQAPESRIA
jgi:hypothetical protein